MPSYEGLCRVALAGAAENAFGIQLFGPANSPIGKPMWFSAASAVRREQLAVALAAISARRKVLVVIPDVKPWAPLKEIYLTDEMSDRL